MLLAGTVQKHRGSRRHTRDRHKRDHTDDTRFAGFGQVRPCARCVNRVWLPPVCFYVSNRFKDTHPGEPVSLCDPCIPCVPFVSRLYGSPRCLLSGKSVVRWDFQSSPKSRFSSLYRFVLD